MNEPKSSKAETPDEDPRNEKEREDVGEVFMRLGNVEFRYTGTDVESAWKNAKAAIDTYFEVREDE